MRLIIEVSYSFLLKFLRWLYVLYSLYFYKFAVEIIGLEGALITFIHNLSKKIFLKKWEKISKNKKDFYFLSTWEQIVKKHNTSFSATFFMFFFFENISKDHRSEFFNLLKISYAVLQNIYLI